MFVFVFKQKTAYEMRISDWSSDVCSSDLQTFRAFDLDPMLHPAQRRPEAEDDFAQVFGDIELAHLIGTLVRRDLLEGLDQPGGAGEIALNKDRKSVVKGKRVSVRVDLGGRRIIKKTHIRQ